MFLKAGCDQDGTGLVQVGLVLIDRAHQVSGKGAYLPCDFFGKKLSSGRVIPGSAET